MNWDDIRLHLTRVGNALTALGMPVWASAWKISHAPSKSEVATLAGGTGGWEEQRLRAATELHTSFRRAEVLELVQLREGVPGAQTSFQRMPMRMGLLAMAIREAEQTIIAEVATVRVFGPAPMSSSEMVIASATEEQRHLLARYEELQQSFAEQGIVVSDYSLLWNITISV